MNEKEVEKEVSGMCAFHTKTVTRVSQVCCDGFVTRKYFLPEALMVPATESDTLPF
jgi:hypothetical protein